MRVFREDHHPRLLMTGGVRYATPGAGPAGGRATTMRSEWTAGGPDGGHVRPADRRRLRSAWPRNGAGARTIWPANQAFVTLARARYLLAREDTCRLAADSVDLVDVSAKLGRRVRILSTWHSSKTYQPDALSIGSAAHTAARLNTAVVERSSPPSDASLNLSVTRAQPSPKPAPGCSEPARVNAG